MTLSTVSQVTGALAFHGLRGAQGLWCKTVLEGGKEASLCILLSFRGSLPACASPSPGPACSLITLATFCQLFEPPTPVREASVSGSWLVVCQFSLYMSAPSLPLASHLSVLYLAEILSRQCVRAKLPHTVRTSPPTERKCRPWTRLLGKWRKTRT